MAREVDIVAQIAEADADAVLAEWFYDNGAEVAAGSIVCSIMIEKAAYDVSAPAAGKLAILAMRDAVVRPGTVLGKIRQA